MSFLNAGIGLWALAIAVILSSFRSSVTENFLTLINWVAFDVGNGSCCVTSFHKHNLK